MTSPTYCAPCIADLALVREAVTTVAGTASCMAHAVLLTHSSDDPGRRRQRLDALRDLANGKAETAEPAEQAKLELLVQEYGLAGAMDMGGPARRAPQAQRPQGQPSAPGEGRKSRRGRDRQRPERGPRPGGGETAPVTPAPGPAGDGAPVEAVVPPAPDAPAPDAPSQPSAAAPAAAEAPSAAPEQTTPLAPQPAPEQTPAERTQPSVEAPGGGGDAVPPTSAPDA